MFVTAARLAWPDTAGVKPLLMVGGEGRRGVICSASYEVRAYGVRAGMPSEEARRLCPDALVVPVPGEMVREKSHQLAAVLERFAPRLEMMSVDEALMSFAGTEDTIYRGESFHDTLVRVRAAVLAETGLTISIGTSGQSATVAKMASELAKPTKGCHTGVFIVAPGTDADFMQQFALADIPGVGPKSAERYAAIGLLRVPDVIALGRAGCVRCFGEREGRWLYDRAIGVDDRELAPPTAQKSMSRMETYDEDLATDADFERELLRLVTRLAGELRDEARSARTVAVTVRDLDFKTRSARRTLPEAITTDRALYAAALELLHKLRDARRAPARLLGLTLSSLAEPDPDDQLGLFSGATEEALGALETERDRKLAAAVDRVRAKFGRDLLKPAALADRPDEDGGPIGPGPIKR